MTSGAAHERDLPPDGLEGIPCSVLAGWRRGLELLAHHLGALEVRLVRVQTRGAEVVLRAPGAAGRGVEDGSDHFSLMVVAAGDEVLVADAASLVSHPHGPAAPGAGIGAYAGCPVRWPGGALCAILETLHSAPLHFSEAGLALFRHVRSAMETDLRCLSQERNLAVQQPVAAGGADQLHFLRTLVDTIPNPTFYKNVEGVFLGCNRAFEQFVGLSREDILGKTFHDITERDDADLLHIMDQALFHSPGVQVHETTFLCPRRGRRDVVFNQAILSDTDGRTVGLVGVVVDVTERKRAHQRARENERFQKSILDAIQDGIMVLSPDLTVMRSNEAMERWCAHAAPLYGRACHEVLHGHHTPCEACPGMRVLETRSAQRAVTEFTDPQGRRRWLEVYAFPVLREDGDVQAIVEYHRDVTDQRAAEQALRASEEKYRAVLEGIEDGYYEVDERGRLVFFNEALGRILGCLPLELMGLPYQQFNLRENRGAIERTFRRVWRTGVPAKANDWAFLRKDGTTGYLDVSVALVRDAQGTPRGFRGIVRDITERKQAEKARRQLEARIQQSQKLESLGVMAGGIAHDFNNILMGILGNTSLALLECEDHAPVREYLQEIERASHRAAQLTSQMVAYSGQGPFELQETNLAELVERSKPLVEAAVSKKCAVEVRVLRDDITVRADAPQVQQVLMNLVTNGAEALQEGGGVVTVAVGVMEVSRRFLARALAQPDLPEGLYGFVEVSDTGVGMAPEVQARMFEPFYSTKFAGRGLGLAAVLGIVRAHHGAIRVLSAPGQGTTVRVCIPLAGATRPERPRRSAEASSRAVGPAEVLVVDDEDPVRLVTRRALERLGHRVYTARDGREGVELYRLRSQDIDLVIMDLAMPEMDGEEAVRAIRAIRPDARIILTSGYSEMDVEQRFHGLGIAGFLPKPYGATDIMTAVRNALES